MKIWIIIGLCMILITPVLAARHFTYLFDREVITICPGCKYYVSCKSNSMGNTLGCNDTLIAIEPKTKLDVKVGDIIWYKRHSLDNRTNKTYIVHRIINKDYRGCYITKGDNNDNADRYKPCFYDIRFIVKGVLWS